MSLILTRLVVAKIQIFWRRGFDNAQLCDGISKGIVPPLDDKLASQTWANSSANQSATVIGIERSTDGRVWKIGLLIIRVDWTKTITLCDIKVRLS